MFTEHEKATKKYVEWALGVLQTRFACLRHSCLMCNNDIRRQTMSVCVIIYNMIFKDERHTNICDRETHNDLIKHIWQKFDIDE